jgi:hypothetical protein
MGKKIDFELNLAGLNELMKSPEMETILRETAEAVAQSCDGEYAASVHQASYVAIANVYPASKDEYWRNLKTNVLLKALGTCGLPMTKG